MNAATTCCSLWTMGALNNTMQLLFLALTLLQCMFNASAGDHYNGERILSVTYVLGKFVRTYARVATASISILCGMQAKGHVKSQVKGQV